MSGNLLLPGGNGMVGRRLLGLLRDDGAPLRTAGRSKSNDVGFDRNRAVDPSMFKNIQALYLVPATMVADPLAITGPTRMSCADACASISVAVGRDIRYEPVDEPTMRELMVGGGVPEDFSEVLLRDQRAVSEGHASVVTAAVVQTIGRPPRGFDAFITEAEAGWR